MKKAILSFLSTAMFFGVIILVFLISIIWKYTIDLPDYTVLAKYEPAVTTRLFAGDGQLLMEYAVEKRIFVPIEKIPDRVKQAFLSAEDKSFYSHSGVDYKGVIRAILSNLKNIGSGRRPAGASTITQQVAKNFLLSSELSYIRKVKEAILAYRIEETFTKDHILELYLNEIYLGNRAYGVAAAALNYFGKSLNDLTIEEIAYLAALPKGPNNYHPERRYDAAVARRNWVITRMIEDGYLAEEEGRKAQAKPLEVIERTFGFAKDAEYFSEEARREIVNKFGEDALYEGGLIVRTTVDPKIQAIATHAFKKGLEDYDIRHGYRGAIANLNVDKKSWKEEFKNVEKPVGSYSSWEKAIVLNIKDKTAIIETENNDKGEIPFSLLTWACKTLPNQNTSDAPKKIEDVFAKGDVILVEKLINKKDDKENPTEAQYQLRQIPNVEGGMIVIDPHTGKVLAAVGGYSFQKSQYNRATQAQRQTGSAFKPLVYLTALENGYSPTDLILDAPYIVDQGRGLPKWKPVNYGSKFYGLTTLRQGIEKSRNLMTVRLAQNMGMEKVAEMTKRLGVNDSLPPLLSMSLGAGETKLIDITNAYAMIVNGGKQITPYFIEKIQDKNGKTIFKQDLRSCETCNMTFEDYPYTPKVDDTREQIIDPLSAYQMVSIMEGVTTRGTGARLASLGKRLAGKTGTTNDNKDAWFIGFSPDLVVGIYIGFDEPRTLGRTETGSNGALPIFYEFMKEALKDQPDKGFRIPRGIRLVRVNHDTGKPATPQDTKVITEALKPNFRFNDKQRVIGSDAPDTQSGNSGYFFPTEEENDFQMGAQY